MPNKKSTTKAKEPVRIRERKLANGNVSLYLDIYSKGVRKVESLGLYIVPEKTPIDKRQNQETRKVAEKIKSEPHSCVAKLRTSSSMRRFARLENR